LIDAVQHTPVGRIMSSFVLLAYSESYPDVALDDYVTMRARLFARDMANRCLAGRKALFSVFEAFMVGDTIFATPPTSGALGERFAQNTPDRPLRQPLLIAQGLADTLVLPQIQSEFVRRRCGAGQILEYRAYAGQDHLSGEHGVRSCLSPPLRLRSPHAPRFASNPSPPSTTSLRAATGASRSIAMMKTGPRSSRSSRG
jgi:hypothetical protein